MRRDPQEALRRVIEIDVYAEVFFVLDTMTAEHEGDWPTLNAIDLMRSRLHHAFACTDLMEDDDDADG
jgi:hypothetical protein